MVIEHIGHAEFLLTLESGMRIVTDPYDASCGYPVERIQADGVLVSHHHHDHDAVENITGNPQVIDFVGPHTFAPDVKVTGLLADHDDEGGKKRGKTLLFLLEAENLRVVHMGDIGRRLTAEEVQFLLEPDVLMIPVGGFFTIDAKTAKETADLLEAKIVIPMHYKTQWNADWPITGPEEFIDLYPASKVREGGAALRVTRGDMECQPGVVMLADRSDRQAK